MKSSSHVALISDIQEDLEDDVDEKYAKKMKVVDQFQRCRIAELQRAQSRSNFAHKNVTFIKSLSLFCDGQHDLSDGDDGDDDVGDDGDDDIYIMMKCVFVCLSRKMITTHFRAERWRREVSRTLGLAGRRPALA